MKTTLLTLIAVALVTTAAPSAEPAHGQTRARPVLAKPAAAKPVEEPFAPDFNTNGSADNLLRTARNQAEAGGYADASARYAELVRNFPRVVAASEDANLYLPLWRIVIEDVGRWPAEGLKAYRAEVDTAAREAEAQELRSGDPEALEAVAEQYFLSSSGDRAAVAAGDRAREAGWPALALYYYTLVLDKYPDPHLTRAELALRAALAAREAGLDSALSGERFRKLREEAKGAKVQTGAGQATAAPKWLEAQAAQEPPAPGPASGRGVTANVAAVAPAMITWETPLVPPVPVSTNPQQALIERSMAQQFQTGDAGTPRLFPTVSDNVVYLAAQAAVWAIDARTGTVTWRFETPNRPKPYPQQQQQRGWGQMTMPSEARQAVVADGVVYAAIEAPPAKEKAPAGEQMFAGLPRVSKTDLYALEAGTGRELWRWNPRESGLEFAELNVEGCPAILDDTVVVALGTAGIFSEIHTAALDRKTGKLRWAQPIGGYASVFRGRMSWGMTEGGDTASTAVVVRGGLVFSSGMGLTTAQSLAGGRILWSRRMAVMKSPAVTGQPGVFQQPKPGLLGALVEGTVINRLPRLLADRGLVLSGCILSPDLEAYDWLDGHTVWSQAAAGARHLLAVRDGQVIAWGTTVAAFGLADGRPAWAPQELPTPIVAEPVVSLDGKVVAPTVEGVVTIDLATGKMESQTALPVNCPSGNLALSENGLLSAGDTLVTSFLDWETARTRYLKMAQEKPSDGTPLLALGLAALRTHRFAEGIEYLEQAADRELQEAQRNRLYKLYEEFYLAARTSQDVGFTDRILGQMARTATGGEALCRCAMLTAAHVAAENPRQAVANLQTILDHPATRQIMFGGASNPTAQQVMLGETLNPEAPVGPGVSGILAEEAIGRLIARFGREIYEPWELAAEQARRAALATKDGDGLIEAAARYPNSRAARRALDDSLELALARPDLTEANRLLARLVNMTPTGERQTRYRVLLADTSRRLGMAEIAHFQAQAAERTAEPGTSVALADGSPAAVEDLARDFSAPGAAALRPEIAEPPYRAAWKFSTQQQNMGNMGWLQPVSNMERGSAQDVADEDVADGPGKTALYMWSANTVLALSRQTGELVWKTKLENIEAFNGQQTKVTRNGIFCLGVGAVASLDPATGAVKWKIRLQPASRRWLLRPAESLTGALRYGNTGFHNGSGMVPSVLRTFGKTHLLVYTDYNLHLIDVRDGYTEQTVGFPLGALFFPRGDQLVIQPIVEPENNGIYVCDYATGNIQKHLIFDRPLSPMTGAGNNSRYRALPSADGKKVWIIDFVEGQVGKTITLPAGESGTVRDVQVGKDTIIISDEAGRVTAYGLADGKLRWKQTVANETPPPNRQPTSFLVLNDDLVAVVSVSAITALRTSDGSKAWEISSPTVQQYAITAVFRRHLAIRSNSPAGNNRGWYQRTSLFDLSNGREIFRTETGGGADPEAFASLVSADALGLLMRNRRNELVYLVHDPAGTIKFDAAAGNTQGDDSDDDQ